jgi:hypothetical protein
MITSSRANFAWKIAEMEAAARIASTGGKRLPMPFSSHTGRSSHRNAADERTFWSGARLHDGKYSGRVTPIEVKLRRAGVSRDCCVVHVARQRS